MLSMLTVQLFLIYIVIVLYSNRQRIVTNNKNVAEIKDSLLCFYTLEQRATNLTYMCLQENYVVSFLLLQS